MAGADAVIELGLGPTAGVPGSGSGIAGCRPAGRAAAETLVWHDTQGHALASDGMTLLLCGGTWSLQRLRASAAVLPPSVLESATRREVLGTAVPAMVVPAATWSGTRQPFRWTGPEGEVDVTVWRGAVGGAPLGRLSARGEPAVLGFFAVAAAAAGAQVPLGSFGAEALALSGHAPAGRSLGAPELRPGSTVGGAAAAILDHLSDVMLHWAARIPTAAGPEPVHQMRVATRRLRSALSMFGAALPALDAFAAPARECAARLGQVRDWDVFVGGAGARIVAGFPGDRRCVALLRAAGRARVAGQSGLVAFLAGTEFRVATVALATAAGLQPWRGTEGAEQPIDAFAAAILARRHHQIRRAGRGIQALPVAALHELRKECKRLRYSVDFLADLYPARPVARLQRRLAALQEELGHLNDAATVPRLLGELGRLERGYAAGLLVGLAEGRADGARHRVVAAWRRFRAAESFWIG